MNLEELRRHKPQILSLAGEYGISDIRVFGSVARGEANENSDLDLLVHVPDTVSLLQFVRLQSRLSEALQFHVDIVPEGGINPHLRAYILHDAVPL